MAVFLTGAAIGELLNLCQIADRVLTMESGALASLMGGTVAPRLSQLLSDCEAAVGWLRDRDGVLEGTLRQLGVRSVCLATPVPLRGVHQTRRFWEVLGNRHELEKPVPCLTLPAALMEAAARQLRTLGISDADHLVLCHPGSGSLHKCIRPETMAAVISRLQQAGYRPAIVSGPADGQAVAGLMQRGMPHVPVIEQPTLPTLAGMLARARLFLGHDSGVSHLAAAIGTPTVALFGPTDPSQWAPLGDHVSVITGSPCSCAPWAEVQRCQEKPCLAITPETIASVCLTRLTATVE